MLHPDANEQMTHERMVDAVMEDVYSGTAPVHVMQSLESGFGTTGIEDWVRKLLRMNGDPEKGEKEHHEGEGGDKKKQEGTEPPPGFAARVKKAVVAAADGARGPAKQ